MMFLLTSSLISKADAKDESDAEEGEEEFVDAVFTLAEVSALFKLQPHPNYSKTDVKDASDDEGDGEEFVGAIFYPR